MGDAATNLNLQGYLAFPTGGDRSGDKHPAVIVLPDASGQDQARTRGLCSLSGILRLLKSMGASDRLLCASWP